MAVDGHGDGVFDSAANLALVKPKITESEMDRRIRLFAIEREREKKLLEKGGVYLRGFVWMRDTLTATLYCYQDGKRVELPIGSLTPEEMQTLLAASENQRRTEKEKDSSKLLAVLLVLGFVLGVVFPPAGILFMFAAFCVWLSSR